MRRAEVLENLSMLSVWRTGCERHGVMRTYVCTQGSHPMQLDHHPDFPSMRLYREQSTQGMQGDGSRAGSGRPCSCSHASCVEPKHRLLPCSCLQSRLMSENSFCWTVSFVRGQSHSYFLMPSSYSHRVGGAVGAWEGACGPLCCAEPQGPLNDRGHCGLTVVPTVLGIHFRFPSNPVCFISL